MTPRVGIVFTTEVYSSSSVISLRNECSFLFFALLSSCSQLSSKKTKKADFLSLSIVCSFSLERLRLNAKKYCQSRQQTLPDGDNFFPRHFCVQHNHNRLRIKTIILGKVHLAAYDIIKLLVELLVYSQT